MKNTLFRILSTEADATRAYDKYGNDTSNYITNKDEDKDEEDAGNGKFIYKNHYNSYNGNVENGASHVYALIVGKDCTKFIPKAYDNNSYSYSYTGSSELEHIFVTGGNTSYVSGNYYEALINSTTNTLELGCKNTIIPSFVTSIGAGAFVNTGESIVLPSSITSIGDHTFSGCSLKSITIPSSSVTSIGDHAFSGCSLESITIPSSVTNIGASAFERCSSLKTVTIPSSSSVTSIEIGNRTFWGCSSLESITISSSVTSIGESAFERCESLNSITIPSSSSITSIGYRTFFGCSSLKSITLPSSVTSIGESAFDHCGSLESITIPSSVTSIGDCAFDQGYSLSTIRFGGTVSDWGNVTLGKDWKARAGIEVICSDGTVTL